ncbi:MAG: thiaminase II [Thermomicrobiales bacterium]|nr:thiaminase II [Thermomicrobiales bacterium]
MAQRFTSELWASIDSIYAAIVAHPFVAGLTDGTLDDETFRQYAIQDAIYLQDFARSIAATAAKAPRDAWAETLAEHARFMLVGERSLHEGFFAGWGLSEADVYATPPSPTCLAYTSYLVRVAWSGTFEEALTALLPCYWIYWEVGKLLEQSGSPNELYSRWIAMYASDEFAGPVQTVIAMLDDAVADLPDSRRERLRQHFLTTSRYEWMFWDAAYRNEAWPL